jgi:hypothetical protein
MKLPGIVFLLALLSAAAAQAQAPDMTCTNSQFASETTIGQAKVAGTDKLYFLNGANGCPSEAAACRQRAYVVGGDVVLTGRTVGAYVCAFYPNRTDGSAGWVQTARLTPQPVNTGPALTAWVGHWVNGDDKITLTIKKGLLSADGDAWWPSAHPSPSQYPGGPNEGDLSGDAAPKANRVVFTDNDPNGCTATLTLAGGLLLVADNGGCGGMNVSFSGVYTRK